MIRRIRQWFEARRYKLFTSDIVQSNIPWRSGDLAVCLVSASSWRNIDGENAAESPDRNQVYRVAEIGRTNGKRVLRLSEFGDLWWAASAFRKAVLPSNEACEPTFAKLLRRTKRKVSA